LGREDVRKRRCGRAPGGVDVGVGARVPVGGGGRGWRRVHVELLYVRCCGRAPGGVEVASRAGLSVERDDVCIAAIGGHLEVLEWVREHLCPWDASTCACAANAGRLEVLKWARENHCPWDARTRRWAEEEVTWRCCSGRWRLALLLRTPRQRSRRFGRTKHCAVLRRGNISDTGILHHPYPLSSSRSKHLRSTPATLATPAMHSPRLLTDVLTHARSRRSRVPPRRARQRGAQHLLVASQVETQSSSGKRGSSLHSFRRWHSALSTRGQPAPPDLPSAATQRNPVTSLKPNTR